MSGGQIRRPTLAEIWSRCAPFVVPWDGMVTQFWLGDLPRADMGRCLDLFTARAGPVFASTLFSFSPAADRRPAFDSALRTQLSIGNGAETYHVLEGTLDGARQLSLWLIDRPESAQFDLELPFWADQFFPAHQSDAEHRRAFGELYGLVEAIGAPHPACRCVLTAGAVNPRSPPGDGLVVVW